MIDENKFVNQGFLVVVEESPAIARYGPNSYS